MIDPSGNIGIGGIIAAVGIGLTIYTGITVASEFVSGERELSAREVGIAVLWAWAGSKLGPLGKRFDRWLRKSGCLSNSFSPDTVVMTSDGLRAISQIKVGDLVLSQNELSRENEYEQVTDVMFSDGIKELVRIKLVSGEVIHATPEHLMFTQEGLTEAGGLVKGSKLVTEHDQTEVADVNFETRHTLVYDLTVAQNRNFFVSSERVLVHNISPCEKAAQGLAKAVPKVCHGVGMCKDFARSFEGILVKRKVKGKRICLKSRTGRLTHDNYGTISTNGDHVATRVGVRLR
jgi:hypothetical protein